MMRIILVLLSLLASTLGSAATAKWDLNDVSILLPLPSSLDADPLLKAGSEGAHGALLPKAHFDRFPRLSQGFTQDKAYAHLRVLAIRIDPCFPGHGTRESECRRQIRMVWQPLEEIPGQGRVRANDSAVHTFYDLTPARFELLKQRMMAWKAAHSAATEGEPLGIHPAIQREGLEGPAYASLRRIVLEFAGSANLTRLTFMTLKGAANVWDFGGFDVKEGALDPMTVPRVGTTFQRFFNNALPTFDFFGTSGTVPEPKGPDTLGLLARPSRLIRPQEDEKAILEAALSALRIENPRFHSPDTMDCVSCHVAQPARQLAIRQFPWLGIGMRGQEFSYASSAFDLKNQSAPQANTTNLRALGYFGEEPAISQRVIHESAEVAEHLNRE